MIPINNRNVLKQLSFRLIVFSLFVILVSAACGKDSGGSGGGGTPTPPPPPPVVAEENIVFTYDIDPGANIYAALGATQEVKITVTSKMPTAGVTTDIVVKRDSDGVTVSSTPLPLVASTSVPITSTISNLATNVVCTATITLKSASTATNTATKSFKIARK